ncbi:Vacuolar protein sorting-associated protein 41 [Xylographa soralifera]|nr:Vacuolar protein sorting-associated protein 41 [Xylographa soralifera]
MALGVDGEETSNDPSGQFQKAQATDDMDARTDENEEEEEEDDEEDDEPRLKYASLTKSQGPVYRNGDATSAFLVAGDKMIIGTHNGNIHVLLLPSFQSLRSYRPHSASITGVSISPFPPPLPNVKTEVLSRASVEPRSLPARAPTSQDTASPSAKSPRQVLVPATPSNSIHIATSSIDGNVCISSLIDSKDVLLRNFGRPVQAVAISPEYKNDRSYISGGLAGNLILTTGGRPGTSSTSNTTGGAAATASGWLGTIGLGTNNGNDTVLHSGEGSISAIKWSLSGKYIVWVNEQGIKIMRSNLHLENSEIDFAWKRISHIDRPNLAGWEDMAGLWKARLDWVDEDGLEMDDEDIPAIDTPEVKNGLAASIASGDVQSIRQAAENKRIEKLIVGWGGTIWIINVKPGGTIVGKDGDERKAGLVEVVTILRTDCIISGVSLYTPKLLLVLAYLTTEEDRKNGSSNSQQGTPKRGVHRRQNALQPEMRIIDIATKEEVCVADTLKVSRFQSLSATDYHLGVLPLIKASTKVVTQRGALEVIGGIGGGLWDVTRDATMYPTRLFSSAASVRSNGSNSDLQSGKSTVGLTTDINVATLRGQGVHPDIMTRGMKIFIQSPYDCVLATKPTIADHLSWLEVHEKYEEAWILIDVRPEAANLLPEKMADSSPGTPTKAQASLVDFFADDNSQTASSQTRNSNSQAEKEKRRLGEKWLQQLVKNNDWTRAGQVAGQVLGTSSSWEHWVWVFAEANKFQEITPYIPTVQLQPPLPSLVYEFILGHYISHDRPRLNEVLERWSPELFDVHIIIARIEGKLKVGDVREDTVEDGVAGRDWQVLMKNLAKLYLADGRAKDALRCYIKLQDADAAMTLISDYRLVEAISDDLPGLILLRISKEQQKSAPLAELEEASIEPIRLLVDEAHHGTVRPEIVISQLENRSGMLPYLFFYLRALWNGDTYTAPTSPSPEHPSPKSVNLAAMEGKSLVNDHADLAVSLFAEYDRALFFTFLKSSQSYTLEKASTICDSRQYIPELVYLLAKEGRTKEALSIIIDKIADVSQAIAFAKEQDDPDLWGDLLDYSMNKPSFIRGLLEEVGTSINPIALVRRIPEGLEIEGLRQGLSRMIREYELQDSISEGVARVLRGEVVAGMKTLRTGQKRGVKFDIVHQARPASRHSNRNHIHPKERPKMIKPGHCAGCGDAFFEDGKVSILKIFPRTSSSTLRMLTAIVTATEKQTLVGYPCAHIFHLSCLLTYTTENNALPDEEGETPSTRDGSIGPKIRHASQLKGKIGGCPVNVHKEDKI